MKLFGLADISGLYTFAKYNDTSIVQHLLFSFIATVFVVIIDEKDEGDVNNVYCSKVYGTHSKCLSIIESSSSPSLA